MNRLSIVLLFSVVACDFGSTDLGTLDETDSGNMSGSATTNAPDPDDTGMPGTTAASTSTTSGPSPTSESSTSADPTEGTSSSSSTSSAGSTGEEVGSSTGEPEVEQCELEGCWAECSFEFDAPAPFEGETPCYGASEGWAEPPCESVGTELCPQLDPFAMSNPEFQSAAQCFLNAVQGDVSGRLSYRVGGADFEETTVFVNGDGTVVLDARSWAHCGNGGLMGARYIMTRNLDVASFESGPLLECLELGGPKALDPLTECVFGTGLAGLFNPDELPWLAGSCSAEAPWCSF